MPKIYDKSSQLKGLLTELCDGLFLAGWLGRAQPGSFLKAEDNMYLNVCFVKVKICEY